MIIQIDEREQANTHIVKYFVRAGIDHFCASLDFGDYYADGRVVVERKRSLTEFAANCGKGHQRFKRELERLDKSGFKMYVVIEEETEYNSISNWVNPRGKVKYRKLKDGTVKAVTTMTGAQMKAICDKWLERHNVEFVFCSKKDSPKMIAELLQKDI